MLNRVLILIVGSISVDPVSIFRDEICLILKRTQILNSELQSPKIFSRKKYLYRVIAQPVIISSISYLPIATEHNNRTQLLTLHFLISQVQPITINEKEYGVPGWRPGKAITLSIRYLA